MFLDNCSALSDEERARIDVLNEMTEAEAFTEDALLDELLAESVHDSFGHQQALAAEFHEFFYTPTPKTEGRLHKRLRLRAAQKWNG